MRGLALLAGALALLLASVPAAAQVVVTSCADVGAGVEVGAQTAFAIDVQRDPAQATAARLDFTAFDPDNIGGVEVEVAINPAAFAVPELQSLLLGNNSAAFDNRRVGYSVALPTNALVQGANTVVFNDLDDVSPFRVDRVCLTLIDAPPPSPPPASEIFCASNVDSPDPTQADASFGTASSAAPGAAVLFDVDVYLSDQARVGLDLVAYVDSTDAGDHTGGLSSAAASLTQAFVATNGVKDDQYLITRAPEPSGLLLGGSEQQPTTNTLTAEGTFAGHFWSACLVVEDTFAPPEPDAGPLEPDAGVVVDPDPDAGVVVDPDPDGGVVVTPDAGPGPKPDAGGLPPGDDAGGQIEPNDAGPGQADEDAGLTGENGDDGGRNDDGDLPGDAERTARAELTDPSFSVASSCASTGGDAWLPGAFALLWLLLRRRRSPLAT